MKTIKFITLVLILILATNLFAQNVSKIKPASIVWVANGDTISIEKAKTMGIKSPDKLEIVVLLDPKTIGKFNKQKLEFRWYKQGPTRQVITNSFTREINTNSAGSFANKISTSRKGLRKGWWKVQIEAYSDRKLLSHKGQKEFWINLK